MIWSLCPEPLSRMFLRLWIHLSAQLRSGALGARTIDEGAMDEKSGKMCIRDRLAAMETAGKEIEDDTMRQAMKDGGIGTPATCLLYTSRPLLRQGLDVGEPLNAWHGRSTQLRGDGFAQQ